MASIDDLVNSARRYLPAVPDITIENMAHRTYRKFCRESEVWQVPFDEVTYSAGTRYFDASLLLPRHAMLYRILWMSVDGKPLEKMRSREVMLREVADRGRPSAFVEFPSADLQIFPPPKQDVVITGAGVLQPKSSTNTVEDFIVDRYEPGLVAGLVADILTMPQREWHDMRTAQAFLREYAATVQEARDWGSSDDGQVEYTMSYGGI